MTSRAGYWIGAALIVVGVVGAVVWGVLGFRGIEDTVDGFERVRAPGSRTVQLQARKYVVYLEAHDADAETTPPIQFTVTDRRTERALPASPYSGSLTYAIGEHSGTALATVRPPRAGRYVVEARSTRELSGDGVAIGRSIGSTLGRAIGGALAIGALLGLGGLGLIAATGIRRSRRGT